MDVFGCFSSSNFSKSNCDKYGLKCQVCQLKRIRFYCQSCVKNGDFTDSTKIHCSDRFAEKSMKLIVAKRAKQEFGLESKLKSQLEIDALKQDISATQERIRLLKCIINTKEDESKANLDRVIKLRQRVERVRARNQKSKRNVAYKLKKLEAGREKLIKRTSLLGNIHKELSCEISSEVQSLIQCIFLINEVKMSNDDPADELSCTMSQLDEAARTSYIRGNWVQLRGEESFQIVQSQLPASGDYNLFYNLLSTYGVGSASSEQGFNNCLHGFSSALTYTAQLLSVLSFIFNVRFPHKLNYSEFSLEGLTISKLIHRVAKLNANIMYLCLAQGVDSDAVHPRQTLYNLNLLFHEKYCRFRKTKDLCQDSSMVDVIEEQLVSELNNGETDEDSDDEQNPVPDDSLDISPDWEAVPRSIPSEELHYSVEHAPVEQGFTGSIVSSAAASVVSLWRGYTGGHK